ncbi:MAG: hypothetical protein IJV27_05310 [Prevotella sp.]|nr:hypothetical protein [Prevotella sp.]
MKKWNLWLISAIFLFLYACKGEEQISRDYLCRFAFNYQLHPTSKILTAVNSPGYFVWVTIARSNGIVHVLVHPADGSGDEDNALTTDKENYITYELGAYNGIFIGCTNFGGPVAYDRQCPNCLETYGTVNYPLTWVESKPMFVECTNCHRTYSLETGAPNEGGKRLMQYIVSRNSEQIIVRN